MAMAEKQKVKNVENILCGLIDNLQAVKDQLKDGESHRSESADFNLQQYWNNIDAVAKALGHRCTTLTLAFSNAPLPNASDVQKLVQDIEATAIALFSAFHALPKSQGLTLRKSTTNAVSRTMGAVQAFAGAAKTEGIHGKWVNKDAVGVVWGYCDGFSKLPKDNQEAALVSLKANSDLVKDALEEIEEALQGGDQWDDLDDLMGEGDGSSNEDAWSEADKDFIGPCIGLVKMTKICLKKLTAAVKKNGQCDTERNTCQLDDLVEHVEKVQPAVDDLICGLYPPLRHQDVKNKAELLSGLLKTVIEAAKHTHVTSEDDASWVEALLKAIQHNLDKAQNFEIS